MKNTITLFGFTILMLVCAHRSLAQTPTFTGGHIQALAVCENSPAVSIDTLLAVSDTSTGHTVAWSVVTTPAHGTLVAAYTASSAAGTLTPTGLTYMPATGYSGSDVFAVRFADGSVSDTTTVNVTVDTLLDAGTITGADNVCVDAGTTLTDTVTGGTWRAVNGHASVSVLGIVHGHTPGLDTIMYSLTNACGTAGAVHLVTVNGLPNAGRLATPDSVCIGDHITLMTGGDPGGLWHSTNVVSATVSSTGDVYGVAPGTARIAYFVTNGCGNDTAIAEVKVQAHVLPIIGETTVCPFQLLTLLDPSPGGSWSSSNFFVAAVVGGAVVGLTSGTATISYSLINACGTTTATLDITVLTAAECGAAVKGTTNTADALNIYPNPNTGTFTVTLTDGTDEPARVIVTNVVGEKIAEFSTTTNQAAEVKLNKSAGLYFINASTSHGIYSAKVVVN